MITTLFLIALAIITIAKIDTLKNKGTIFIVMGCLTMAQFFDHRTYEAKIDVLRERINELEGDK